MATAISMPGQAARQRRSPRMIATVSSATAAVVASRVGAAAASAASLGKRAGGSAPSSVSPKNSRSWLAPMISAIAAVKPTVTG